MDGIFFLPFTKGIKRRIFLFKFNKFADVYVCAIYIKHLVIRMTAIFLFISK